MSSKRSAIPVLTTGDVALRSFASAVKSNVDALTGQQEGAEKLSLLPDTATLADVIKVLNILIKRHGS